MKENVFLLDSPEVGTLFLNKYQLRGMGIDVGEVILERKVDCTEWLLSQYHGESPKQIH